MRPVEEAFADTREAGEHGVEFVAGEDAGGGDGAGVRLQAATSWGSRRQSKGKVRCHCSKVRSRGSRKRPDHILVGCCDIVRYCRSSRVA